jgi:hypothetical protein
MSSKRRLSLLLSSTLETLAHQILYARHVYPRDAFAATRFLGVRCHACRHPLVVRYIHDSVALAVPSLLVGASSELQIVICEADGIGSTHRELETYRLRLQGLMSDLEGPDAGENDVDVGVDEGGGGGDHDNDDDEDDNKLAIENGERAVRDLMIRVLGMEAGTLPLPRSDSLSFRIVLRVAEKDVPCPELDRAFATGRWVSSQTPTKENGAPMIRPLYESPFGSGSLSLQQLVRRKTIPKLQESAALESSQVREFEI